MTTLMQPDAPTRTAAPYSSALRIAAGISLIAGGLLNGGAQYLAHLVSGDPDDYIRWGAAHPGVFQTEQLALLVSMFFLPLGLLGVAHVARWRSPHLTAAATALFLWGLWGFHNVLALWYAAGSIVPDVLGVDAAVRLDASYSAETSVWVTALIPHLVGSFFGLLLLCLAARHAFPRPALALLAAFLLWDFLGSAFGPLEAHLLLAIALPWLGVHVLRMSQSTWVGQSS